jgi:predicted metal-dependent hydrolase
MKRLILILALAIPVCAQTPKPADAPKPPAISDAQRAQFFKAQSQMIQANVQAQQKQTEFQNAVAEMQKTCGDKYTLQLNPNGDPECVAKLVPAKAAK